MGKGHGYGQRVAIQSTRKGEGMGKRKGYEGGRVTGRGKGNVEARVRVKVVRNG